MFVDASALVAVLLEEQGYQFFVAALDESHATCVTPFVVMEVGLAAMRETGRSADDVHSDIRSVIRHFRIQTVELAPAMILAALQAYERYGKGRHPARLNMGDCLSYAAARTLDVPLLYKGEDFARTDIRSALA